MTMTHASVFSGIGGPEVAAAMLGWDNLFHCEINPFCRAVLEYWFPNAKSYEDITTTDFSDWGGRVNVLTGGFPCQPFSYAGQRRGADDDRYLWPFMHRCIYQVRPDWVVCENVAGITTMVEQGDVTEMEAEKSLFSEVDLLHRYRLDETFTLERVCNDLENDGYAVQAVVIPACAVNAPHRRDRVFIIGHRNDAENAMCSGQLRGQNDITGDKRDIRNACAGDCERLCGEAPGFLVADADCNRGGEMDEHLQPRLADGSKPVGNGRERVVYDTSSERPQTGHRGRETGEANRDASGWYTRSDCNIAGLGRWDEFPTQSPIHRGNDGIPFPLDDLTIPASKWRTESIKAYGNAIVPQVMYEIFKAIESTY